MLYLTIIAMVVGLSACEDSNPIIPTAKDEKPNQETPKVEVKITGEKPGSQMDNPTELPLLRIKFDVYNSSGTQRWGGLDTLKYYTDNFPWENGISTSGIPETTAMIKVNINWQGGAGKNVKFRRDNTTSKPLFDINLAGTGQQNYQHIFTTSGTVPYTYLQFFLNTYVIPTKAKK